MDILVRIKQLVLRGRYILTFKADREAVADGLCDDDIIESIVNASRIEKTLNSTDPQTGKRDRLYIIKARNYSGTLIYTKGKIGKRDGEETLYILISSKRAL